MNSVRDGMSANSGMRWNETGIVMTNWKAASAVVRIFRANWIKISFSRESYHGWVKT